MVTQEQAEEKRQFLIVLPRRDLEAIKRIAADQDLTTTQLLRRLVRREIRRRQQKEAA